MMMYPDICITVLVTIIPSIPTTTKSPEKQDVISTMLASSVEQHTEAQV